MPVFDVAVELVRIDIRAPQPGVLREPGDDVAEAARAHRQLAQANADVVGRVAAPLASSRRRAGGARARVGKRRSPTASHSSMLSLLRISARADAARRQDERLRRLGAGRRVGESDRTARHSRRVARAFADEARLQDVAELDAQRLAPRRRRRAVVGPGLAPQRQRPPRRLAERMRQVDAEAGEGARHADLRLAAGEDERRAVAVWP
jgi:hypothetical protein